MAVHPISSPLTNFAPLSTRIANDLARQSMMWSRLAIEEASLLGELKSRASIFHNLGSSQHQLPEFGLQRFDIDGWPPVCFITENTCRSLKGSAFPLLDLVGLHIKPLGQFHRRLFISDGAERHPRLESWAMVAAWSSCHDCSCFRHLSRRQAEISLILTVQISRAASQSFGLITLHCCGRAILRNLLLIASQAYASPDWAEAHHR